MNKKWMDLSIEEMVSGIDKIYNATEEEKMQTLYQTKDFRVSTVFALDFEKWETAIAYKEQNWFVVEQYNTKEEASLGHLKWVESLPNLKKLTDINFNKEFIIPNQKD